MTEESILRLPSVSEGCLCSRGMTVTVQGTQNNPRLKALGWELQEQMVGTSLVVQWLGIQLPMQGTQVQSLVWEDATCYGATKPVHDNTGPACLQPVLYNKRSHCNRNLGMASKSRPSSLELEKACV